MTKDQYSQNTELYQDQSGGREAEAQTWKGEVYSKGQGEKY